MFFTTSVLLALAPGPDNLFVLAQSAHHGRSAGMSVTLGLCTGLMLHTLAVALGVATLVQTSALALSVVKSIGAAYLLYLAWRAFGAGSSTLDDREGGATSFRRLYSLGIIMNVTNPKVGIFFLAFLPQFADPARGPLTLQLIALGGVFILATLLVFGSIAWVAGFLRQRLRRTPKAQIVMNRIAGTVFVVLAGRLAMTSL